MQSPSKSFAFRGPLSPEFKSTGVKAFSRGINFYDWTASGREFTGNVQKLVVSPDLRSNSVHRPSNPSRRASEEKFRRNFSGPTAELRGTVLFREIFQQEKRFRQRRLRWAKNRKTASYGQFQPTIHRGPSQILRSKIYEGPAPSLNRFLKRNRLKIVFKLVFPKTEKSKKKRKEKEINFRF